MIRLERVDRRTFFEGMTPGWVLGAVGYVAAVLTLYFLARHTGKDLTPCLLRQSTGLACPLCGGTTAAVNLATGNPLVAFASNPAVSVGLPLAGIWITLRAGFGIAIRPTFPKPIIVALVIAVVAANWAYVVRLRATIALDLPAGSAAENTLRLNPVGSSAQPS